MAKEETQELEADATGEEGAAPAKGKLTKKKIIILAAVLVLLAGAVGAAFFLGLIPGGKKDADHAAEVGKTGEHAASTTDATGTPVYYSVPEFLVNLNAAGKQTSFLKMEVSLELSSPDDVAFVEANLPKIQDVFNSYLRELRPSDLSGSAGLYRLKEELMLRLNQTLAPKKIKDILFKEILIQ